MSHLNLLIAMTKLEKAVKSSLNARSYRLQFAQELPKHGLTYIQLECLYEIRKAKCQPSYIADKPFHERASVSRVLKELDGKKLISYTHDTVDRRKVYVEISNKGKSILDLIEAATN